MTFDPKSFEVTCVTQPKDHCNQVPWKYIKVCGHSDPFFKNLNQRSPWPLDDLWLQVFLRSHVWRYPKIIVSRSHENSSKYVDTVTLWKIWNKGHWPLDDLWPHVCWGDMCDSTQGSYSLSLWISWQWHVRNTLFHFCQLWAIKLFSCDNV